MLFKFIFCHDANFNNGTLCLWKKPDSILKK